MGKGGLFLTFLVSVVLLAVGWYALAPTYAPAPDPAGDEPAPPGDDPAAHEPPVPDSAVGRTVRVTGRVLDRESGKPVAGAVLVFTGEPDEDHDRPEAADAVTDAKGEWAARFRVTPSLRRTTAAGRVTAAGYLPARVSFRIEPWETVRRVRPIRLIRATANVRGRVLTADGKPVPGATVGGVISGEDGRYGPIAVGGGVVTLIAYRRGHPHGTLRFTVDPAAGKEIEKDIYLPASTPLAGIVLDEDGKPLASASCWITGGEEWLTGEDGAFSIPAVNGAYRLLTVMMDGWLPFSGWVYAGRPLTVRLRRGGVLDGRLLAHDGAPAGIGYRVKLRSRVDDVDLLEVPTAEDGRFRLTLPAGGPVEIEVNRGRILAGSFVVELPVGEVLERDFTLFAPQRFPLRVLSAETDAPVEGAEILGGWPVAATTRTDALGGARVETPPPQVGMVYLPFLVRCDGFLPERFVLPSSEAQAGKPRTVKLMPRGAIDVAVLDADGRPVSGANVEVQVSDPRRSYATRTGSDGRVEAVAPAGRQVLVGAISADRGSGTVLATAPAAVTIRLTPLKSAGPRIVVVMASDTEPLEGAWVQAGNGKRVPVHEDGRVEMPGTTDWVYVMAPGKATALLDLEDVEEGAETAVRLDPGRDVDVTVVDQGGRPVTGVRVYVTSGTNRSFPVPTTYTDSNGVAVLHGLPLHTEAFVTAKHHGFTDARAWVAPGATKATVRIAPWGEVVVRLGGTGLRAGQPMSWRWRTLDRTPFAEEAGEVAAQWVPDDSGKVRITVPCGRIALMVECADAAPRIYPDVAVTPDRPGEVVYDFPEPGQAAITVRDEDGNYVEAARLFVTGVNWHFAWTTGRGKIPPDKRKRVPAGRMRLAVSGEGLATVITEPIDLSSPDPVEITLPKGVSVTGGLVDSAGKPVAGRIRVLTHVDQPDRFDEAGDDGRFVLARRLAPGPHQVWVHGRGHRPIVVPIRVTGGESARAELPVE